MRFIFIYGFFLTFTGTSSIDCVHKRNALLCVNKDLLTFPQWNLLNKDIDNLDLSRNSIRILYEDALENFSNLVNLTLDSNKIWKITNNAFKNQYKLQHLSLRNNALIIGTNTFLSHVFRNLDNLQYLDLSNNPLGIIPGDFFVKLRQLRALFLEEMVQEIRILKGALSKLYNLKILSLAKNNFISLPNYMLHEFHEMQLQSLLLHDNPWSCDCRMRWFKLWLITMRQRSAHAYRQIETSLKHIHPMLCNIPKTLHRKLFVDLTLSKFECKPKSISPGKTFLTDNFDNITISCFFESDPKSYVKWFKNGILIQDHWERIKKTQSVGIRFVANLTITNLRYGIDDGSYVCETTNNKGYARANFSLIIKNPSANHDNINEYKNQQTILLLIIVSTGIITLIILVGIVIYCFYGNNATGEMKCANSKLSDLLYVNDNIVMTCSADAVPASQLSQLIYQMKEPPNSDLINWHINETDMSQQIADKMHNNTNTSNIPNAIPNTTGEYEHHQLDNIDPSDSCNENPIVKNYMLNESLFSSPNSDSDNHSCQLSIHDDCPIHGVGNAYNCPVHGSASELKEVEDSSYNWSYVFNNKNTIKNNYYSLKTASNSSSNNNNAFETRYSSVIYPMKLRQSDIDDGDLLISADSAPNEHLKGVGAEQC